MERKPFGGDIDQDDAGKTEDAACDFSDGKMFRAEEKTGDQDGEKGRQGIDNGGIDAGCMG